MDEQIPQNKSNNPSAPLWIILGVVILIIAAVFMYFGDFGSVVNSTDTNNINTSNQSNVDAIIFTQIDGGFEITHKDFSIQIPNGWYTTEVESINNQDILFIASNENTDGIMGLRDADTGLVLYIYSEKDNKGLAQFIEGVKIVPIDIPSERVQVTEVELSGVMFMKRIIDATNLPDWSGVYSVEYFLKIDDRIVRAVFVARNSEAIENNIEVIDSILETIK